VFSFETPGPVLLRISNPSGHVTIETSDEPRVEVDVEPLRNDAGSIEAADETRVEASERGGRHEIVVEPPKRKGGLLRFAREAELSVRVRCPHGADLHLAVASADLDARGMLGTVQVKSASGDVSVDAAASLALTGASGDVRADDVANDANVKTVSGDVELGTVGGDATINAVSGDVRVRVARSAVAVNSVSGDVDLESLAGDLRANTVSGDIAVRVVPGLRLWIDAQSLSGDMSSDLDLGDGSPGDDGPVVELRARSVSGDVNITRAARTS
jgi:DUF4097 and DUF4098 domain-containing protein YvlB